AEAATPPDPTDPSTTQTDGKPSHADMVQILMATVAEKTGYPEELLRLDMELEAGLGIDSIKRMEIFASLRERYPALAAVDVGRVGELRTFADIAALLENPGELIAASPPPVDAPASPDRHDARETPANGALILRHVVAAVPEEAPGAALPGLGRGAPVSVW